MKILIASIPAAGHLNPLLSIATLLVESGHEVAVQVNEDLRAAVEAAGHRFLLEIPNAQTSAGYYFETCPERMQKAPGMEMTGYDLVHFFARNIAAQSASLKMALYDFPADLILADSFYWGTLPMLVGPRDKRPAIAHLGISVVNLGSGKNIPMRTDETPEQREAELQLRKRFMLQPAQQAVNAALASLGYPALPCPILEAMTELPDLYLHPGIESFEYPDSNQLTVTAQGTDNQLWMTHQTLGASGWNGWARMGVFTENTPHSAACANGNMVVSILDGSGNPEFAKFDGFGNQQSGWSVDTLLSTSSPVQLTANGNTLYSLMTFTVDGGNEHQGVWQQIYDCQ
jgi:hypothetical protein